MEKISSSNLTNKGYDFFIDSDLDDQHKIFIWSYFTHGQNEAVAYSNAYNLDLSINLNICKNKGATLLFQLKNTLYYQAVKQHIISEYKLDINYLVNNLKRVVSEGFGYTYKEQHCTNSGKIVELTKYNKDLKSVISAIDKLIKLGDYYPNQKIDQNIIASIEKETGVLVIESQKSPKDWENKYSLMKQKPFEES